MVAESVSISIRLRFSERGIPRPDSSFFHESMSSDRKS